MALEGTFKEFHIADILQLIGLHQKSGTLDLENDEEALKLFLRDGEVVGVRADRPPVEPRVAAGLVARGILPAPKLEEALRQQAEKTQSLGSLLGAAGAVSPKEWASGMAVELTSRLYRPFRWTGGSYRFTPQATPDPGEWSLSPVGVDGLVMEGIRRADEWAVILQDVPSAGLVFRVGGRHGKLNPREIQAADVAMLKLVDGKRTVEELTALSGLGEFEAWTGLANLARANAISAVGPAPAAAGAAPAPSLRRPLRRPAAPDRAAPPAWFGRLAWGVASACLLAVLVGFGWEPLGLVPVSPRQRSALDRVRALRAEAEIRELGREIDAVRMLTGSAPTGLDGLLPGRRGPVQDPWGQPYQIQTEGARVVVTSAGADRRLGTSDDLRTGEKQSARPAG